MFYMPLRRKINQSRKLFVFARALEARRLQWLSLIIIMNNLPKIKITLNHFSLSFDIIDYYYILFAKNSTQA